MITLFSGNPGSGKSLCVAREVLHNIRVLKRDVICLNMYINPDYVRRRGKNDAYLMCCPTYADIVTPAALYDYALRYHEVGKESQTLLVFDEVQMLLASSKVKAMKNTFPEYLPNWLDFFSQHRHLGYEIYVVTQYDRMIHPDIRYLIEYENIHRKFRNASDFAFFLAILFKIFTGKELFIQIRKWKPNREKIGSKVFSWSRRLNGLYDSYKKFSDLKSGDDVVVQFHSGDRINFIEQRESFFPEKKSLEKNSFGEKISGESF